jgi:hypothetical protein
MFCLGATKDGSTQPAICAKDDCVYTLASPPEHSAGLEHLADVEVDPS